MAVAVEASEQEIGPLRFELGRDRLRNHVLDMEVTWTLAIAAILTNSFD